MTSEGWYAGRDEPFTFEELANGSLWEYDHASVSVWVTQTGLVFFFFFFVLRGESQELGVYRRVLGRECDWGT